MRQQLVDAQASVAPFSKLASTFVGYSEVKDEILSAVEYWVVRDEGFRNLCPMPPPQSSSSRDILRDWKDFSCPFLDVQSRRRQGRGTQHPVFAQLVSPHRSSTSGWEKSEKKIAQVFDEAFKRPTILFIDEAQTLAREQGDSSGAPDSGVQSLPRGADYSFSKKSTKWSIRIAGASSFLQQMNSAP